MDKITVKIRDMFKIDNETAVCLEETVFREKFQPVLYIVNGFKITQSGMYRYFSALCFHCYDGRCRQCMYTLFCFNRDFYCHSVIQVNRIFHITEKPLFRQRLKDFLDAHPDIIVEKNRFPDEDKSLADSKALIPTLKDFFRKQCWPAGSPPAHQQQRFPLLKTNITMIFSLDLLHFGSKCDSFKS